MESRYLLVERYLGLGHTLCGRETTSPFAQAAVLWCGLLVYLLAQKLPFDWALVGTQC